MPGDMPPLAMFTGVILILILRLLTIPGISDDNVQRVGEMSMDGMPCRGASATSSLTARERGVSSPSTRLHLSSLLLWERDMLQG